MEYFKAKEVLEGEVDIVVEEPPRLVGRNIKGIISYIIGKRTNIYYDFQHPKRIEKKKIYTRINLKIRKRFARLPKSYIFFFLSFWKLDM